MIAVERPNPLPASSRHARSSCDRPPAGTHRRSLIAVPGWFSSLGRFLPATAVTASLYGALIGHRGVTGLWGTGGLVWHLVTAAAYLAAGILAFRLGERTARTRGTIGAYRASAHRFHNHQKSRLVMNAGVTRSLGSATMV